MHHQISIGILAVFLGAGRCCSGDDSYAGLAAVEITRGKAGKSNLNTKIVNQVVTLKDGSTHTEIGKVMFKSGQTFDLVLNCRSKDPRDAEIGMIGEIAYRNAKGGRVIASQSAVLPQKSDDGQFTAKFQFKIPTRGFKPGWPYSLRIHNANGTISETPIKIAR